MRKNENTTSAGSLDDVMQKDFNLPAVSKLDAIDLSCVLTINRDDLVGVLEKHTALFHHYTSDYAYLRWAHLEVKNILSREQAALITDYKDITSDVYKEATASIGKLTEKMIDNFITLNEGIIWLTDKVGEYKMLCDECERRHQLFLQRDSVIKSMVQLYMGQYWSTEGSEKEVTRGTRDRKPADKVQPQDLDPDGAEERDGREDGEQDAEPSKRTRDRSRSFDRGGSPGPKKEKVDEEVTEQPTVRSRSSRRRRFAGDGEG